eukprot:jgi/Mesvir1/18428/Mv14295-RA.1
MEGQTTLTVVLGLLLFLLFRLGYLLLFPRQRSKRGGPVRVVIVLGSGGHTAEMMSMVAAMDATAYQPRVYVAAVTDHISLDKARAHEKVVQTRHSGNAGSATFLSIPRSREVGQSYVTSCWTTAVACLHALKVVALSRPDLLLCNGPGTCLPLCLSVIFLKLSPGDDGVTVVPLHPDYWQFEKGFSGAGLIVSQYRVYRKHSTSLPFIPDGEDTVQDPHCRHLLCAVAWTVHNLSKGKICWQADVTLCRIVSVSV